MRYYCKIHRKLPIFRVKSVKIYTGQKNLHEHARGARDKYQVCKTLRNKETEKKERCQITNCHISTGHIFLTAINRHLTGTYFILCRRRTQHDQHGHDNDAIDQCHAPDPDDQGHAPDPDDQGQAVESSRPKRTLRLVTPAPPPQRPSVLSHLASE